MKQYNFLSAAALVLTCTIPPASASDTNSSGDTGTATSLDQARVMAADVDGRHVIHVHHAVAGIGTMNCGDLYRRFDPKVRDDFYLEVNHFVEGYITAYNHLYALYAPGHSSGIGQTVGVENISLELFNNCAKNPESGVDDALFGMFMDFDARSR